MSLCSSHKCELIKIWVLVCDVSFYSIQCLWPHNKLWHFNFSVPSLCMCVCVTVLIITAVSTHFTCKNKWKVYILYKKVWVSFYVFLLLFSGSTSHCQCCIWEVFQIFHCIKRPCCSWNNTHDVLVLFLLSHFVDIALLDWSYSWVWWCRLHQVILERVRIFILIFALFIAVSSLQFGKISTQIDQVVLL